MAFRRVRVTWALSSVSPILMSERSESRRATRLLASAILDVDEAISLLGMRLGVAGFDELARSRSSGCGFHCGC